MRLPTFRSVSISPARLGRSRRTSRWIFGFFQILILAASVQARAEHLPERLADGGDGLSSFQTQAYRFTQEGRFSDAAQAAEKALRLAEEQYGPFSSVLAPTLDNLAAVYRHQARWQEAEARYKWALAIREKNSGLDDPAVGDSLILLASLYLELERAPDAEVLYQRALAIREKAFGKNSPETAQVLVQLGRLHLASSRIAEAKRNLAQALEIQEKTLGADSMRLLEPLKILYGVLMAGNDLKKAEESLLRIQAIRQKNLPSGHPETATSLEELADFYQTRGDKKKAQKLYGQALEILRPALGPDLYQSISLLSRAGKAHLALGRPADAETLFNRVLVLRKKFFGDSHPQTAFALADLSEAERQIPGKREKALEDLRESFGILRKNLGESHSLTLQIKKRLDRFNPK